MIGIMSTRQLADYLDITADHIRKERCSGGHPLYSKGFLIGGKLYFYESDVAEYVQACAHA